MNRPPQRRRRLQSQQENNFTAYSFATHETAIASIRALIECVKEEPHRTHVIDLGRFNRRPGEPLICPPDYHAAFIETAEMWIEDLKREAQEQSQRPK